MAKEGAKYNIKVNAIAPIAATAMTKTMMSPEMLEAISPEYVVPLVAVLAHEKCPDSGKVYEVGGGWVTEVRLQRAQGSFHKLSLTPEDVLARWSEVGDFTRENTYPNDLTDTMEVMANNYEKQKELEGTEKTSQSEVLPGKWKSEKIYSLMKAFVEAGLAE